jgi:phosphoribosylformimino-5-aminoimidazole carboxamide ribotide isomerase
MGTSAVEDPDMLKAFCKRYPQRLVLGIDALEGLVKTQGWLKGSEITPSDLVKKFEEDPVAAIIFTDISKDGMMMGPNIEATAELAQQTDIPVIASGGVSSLDHIKQLADQKTISGVICGRALYEEAFTYSDVLEILSK